MRERIKSRLPANRAGILRAGDFRNQVARGSRGGPPIWFMRIPWMPSPCTCKATGRRGCLRHRGADDLKTLLRNGGDPDGFAVFGRYPRNWLPWIIKMQLLGDVARDEILHVCSGTLSATERWTVDIRPEARPRVLADGTRLPFLDRTFRAVIIDPPYTDEYARNLYGTTNPRPSWLLREASRVLKPGGRVGILHFAVPFAPKGCRFVEVYGICTGTGYRIRAFTVFERGNARLPLEVEEVVA